LLAVQLWESGENIIQRGIQSPSIFARDNLTGDSDVAGLASNRAIVLS
jgi:hypothetical protein